MLSDLLDRAAMIDQLCEWFAVDRTVWSGFDQAVLDTAWLHARAHWD